MLVPRFRAARVAALALLGTLMLSRAAAAAPASPALADTGLFAPIAAQQAARRERLARRDALAGDLQGVTARLESGDVDGAAQGLGSLRGDPRAVAVLRTRVLLARQDFAAARPLILAMAARRDASDAERSLRFAWLLAHDDAATVDRLTHGISIVPGTAARVPDLIASGKLAYDLLNWTRAESCYARAKEKAAAAAARGGAGAAEARAREADALAGLGRVLYKKLDYDGSLARLTESVRIQATAEALEAMSETLIRLGRTDEAITADQWAVQLHPYHELAHYFLGNGYARKNYTELAAAYPGAFADSARRADLARADGLLAAGDRAGARALYERGLGRAAKGEAAPAILADAAVRLASLEFEDGHFERSRDLCFAALQVCPEYGRAHAVLSKALEFQRFAVDVHRPGYEQRFAAAAMPAIPGIDSFVVNWSSLSPRDRKRVALSVAPWQSYLPVLIAGGATYFIKPLYMLLSECPGQETLRDQRISYDSRLWDDVRGAGGYHTVTGIEDVERTIFERYNTVLHELTHQVHAVLPPDQGREIQELYRRAKVRDDSTHDAIMSRYAAGSVFEYFAEGANALASPKRDAYDPREVVLDRLQRMDPGLEALVKRLMATRDVSASYPVAFVNAGDDRVERGQLDTGIGWYQKALARSPKEETALESLARAFTLANRGDSAVAAAERGLALQPASGGIAAQAGEALWHGGQPLAAAIARLERVRLAVRPEERYRVDLELGRLHWANGDAGAALAASDSVIAYQSDHPEGLWQRAAALSLAKRWDPAFAAYAQAVRIRTGIVELRSDYARDLLRAGRPEAARAQLDEARLLDAENAEAEALRGWVDLAGGQIESARAHVAQALRWGPWCDLARLVGARIEMRAGHAAEAGTMLSPVRDRISRHLPPEYVYRPKLAVWEAVHELPAVERELLSGSDASAGGAR